MRKLASIREIAEVRPIAGADNIEVAQIDGWQVVVKKGEFEPGDPCIYHEIDCFLPESKPQYSFLAKSGVRQDAAGNRGMRLRTIKLRGQLSQGLALPLSAFFDPDEPIVIGEDVTERLGITKWEPAMPACLAGVARGTFPSWIPKTDQERIQNIPHILQSGGEWEVTIKLDGSSMTAYHRDGDMGVCSRNIDLVEADGNTFWRVARQIGLPDILARAGNVAVQGELIGEGIQGNPEKIAGHQFYVFDVWLIDEQRYMSADERYSLCVEIGLVHVPVLHYRASLPQTVEHALSIADGQSINHNTRREGIVFKRIDGGASFKAISNAYLIREKD